MLVCSLPRELDDLQTREFPTSLAFALFSVHFFTRSLSAPVRSILVRNRLSGTAIRFAFPNKRVPLAGGYSRIALECRCALRRSTPDPLPISVRRVHLH